MAVRIQNQQTRHPQSRLAARRQIAPRRNVPLSASGRRGRRLQDFLRFFDFLFFVLRLGTFLPLRRASDRPMAIACFLLFTVPPLPPLPRFSLPFFLRCMARLTSLPALLEYFLAIRDLLPASNEIRLTRFRA